MSNPKEKAEELVMSFFRIQDESNETTWNQAKQCALIAVDNEIKSIMWLNLLCIYDNYMKEHLNQKVKELQEVKQEIEKL